MPSRDARLDAWTTVIGDLADLFVRQAEQRCATALSGLDRVPNLDAEQYTDPEVRECGRRFSEDRHRFWNLLRARGRIAVAGGSYRLTRRDDVLEALRRPEDFTTAGLRRNYQVFGVEEVPIAFEGTKHAWFRRKLNVAFGPRRVAHKKRALRRQAAKLVDAVADTGECELMADIAWPFSVRALLTFIDFPLSDADRILDALHQILGPGGTAASKQATKSRLIEYISATLAGKYSIDPRCPAAGAKPPRHGVLAYLAGGDDPMTGPELLGA